MPLPMARPWQHPKTGMYWLRRAVPDDLRTLVGKVEEKRSLGTKDPDEARRRHVDAMAEVKARWKALRAGSRTLSEREANEMACDIHDAWLDRHRDEPSAQTFWPIAIGRKVFGPPAPVDMAKIGTAEFWKLDPDVGRVMELENWCRGYADHVLERKGLVVDDNSRQKLAKAVASAVHRASEKLVDLADGYSLEIGVGKSLQVTPNVAPDGAKASLVTAQAVTFDALVKGWSVEAKPRAKTIYEWSRAVRTFSDFLGHTNAADVTSDDVQR